MKKIATKLFVSSALCALAWMPVMAQEEAQQTTETASPVKATTQEADNSATTASGDQLFREALIATYESNPRITAQRNLFQETGEQFNQALSGWLPVINAAYEEGRRRSRFGGASDWTYLDAKSKNLEVTQPLFRPETYYGMSQAQNTIDASGAELISVTQEVLISAITNYLNVVRDREILDLSRNNERVLGKNLNATQDRFDVGETTRTDVSQSEARLSRAQSDTIQAVGNVAISEAAFERVTGFKPAGNLAYPDKAPVLPASLEEVVELAAKNNPRIIGARFTEEAADDAVGVNKSRLLPTVALRGNMSREEGSSINTDEFDSDSLLVSVNIPIYQGGAEYSRVRASKYTKSRRRYEFLETSNEVRQQAISAWEQYQTALAAMKAQEDTIRAAEVALEGVQQEQLYGSRTVLDVLDAEQELFVARVNLARTERDRLVAVYNLLAVIGELSPKNLELGIKEYDREEALDDIKYQLIGF